MDIEDPEDVAGADTGKLVSAFLRNGQCPRSLEYQGIATTCMEGVPDAAEDEGEAARDMPEVERVTSELPDKTARRLPNGQYLGSLEYQGTSIDCTESVKYKDDDVSERVARLARNGQ
ncbi:hypothetical protein NQ176_g3420 [Zarea fungicola]|uniref:Uncharacterized protein n=1 Tax=Zarea fungicola TaxID=93591 RepID=A0ACC1NL68_9HYPO|nr:hypothetical protein NQ176_g3420 [Lecanicillium fungicola]